MSDNETIENSSAESRRIRRFSIVATTSVFLFLALAIPAMGSGGRSELDTLLRRTKGERIGAPITSAQGNYTVEGRSNGRIVPVSLEQFGNKLVFLNFWGTFCPPCIEELPSLLALARARMNDMVVLAVAYDESWEVIDNFFANFQAAAVPPNFIVVRDPQQVLGRDMRSAFGTEKLPESYLLRDGRIEAKFVSARDWISPDIVALVDKMTVR